MNPCLADAIATERERPLFQLEPYDGDVLARAVVVAEAVDGLRRPDRAAVIAPRFRGGPGAYWSNVRPLLAAARKLAALRRRGGMPKTRRRWHQHAAIEVAAGIPYHLVALRFGVSTSAVAKAVRALGVHSPNNKRVVGVPCPSCGGPRGTHTFRCDACDRAHHRNGSCPCGRARRVRAPQCPRCGAESRGNPLNTS